MSITRQRATVLSRDEINLLRWVAFGGLAGLIWALCAEAQPVPPPPPPRHAPWVSPASPPPPRPTGRPTAPPEVRRRQIPDPGVVYQPTTLFIRMTTPSDSAITLFGGNGKPIKLGSSALMGMKTRAVYPFAIHAGLGAKKEPFFGTIDVIRGPHIPTDIAPRDATVPIVFDQEDILQLLRDRMITKYIVLEDPETALDYPSREDQPIRYEATFDQDAINRAKEIGKILICVHIGNRIPTEEELAGATLAGNLMIAKTLSVVDSEGKAKQTKPEFVLAETYPRGPIQQVAYHGCAPGAPCAGDSSTGQPPCAGGSSTGQPGCDGESCQAPLPTSPPGVNAANVINNDLTNNFEYICDGGDRRPHAGWITGGELINVDPEDTIAEYRVANGGKRLAVSNRVCLFAPRYVEIRVLQVADGYETAVGYGSVTRDAMPDQYIADQYNDERKLYQMAGIVRTEKHLKGLEGSQWSGDLFEVRVLNGFEQGIGWAEVINMFGPRELTGTQQLEILKRTEFAATLTLDSAPQIVGMVAGVGEVASVWKTNEIREIIINEKPPGVLKLEKTADKSSAKAGDIVTFAIRYTNIGKQPVSNISVMDSLTARLEYIPESAESSRPAVFTSGPNEVDSLLLRWEVKDTLQPGDSGIVKFKIRMR